MGLQPLRGFVIGVTADRRAGEQVELLARKGASVIHAPVIRTHPLGEELGLATATTELIERPPDLTVLTTGIGVRGWFEAAESLDLAGPLLDALHGSEVLVRGKKAHGAAVTAGLPVAWQASAGTAAEVVEELSRRGVHGRRVAVQLDGAAGAPLADLVAALGASVVPVPVYRWTLPDDVEPAERLLGAIVARRVHAVTFTARPQVQNLCGLAAERGVLDEVVHAFRDAVAPVCVGPVCAAAAVDAGFPSPIVPERHRLGSMVLALTSVFLERGVDLVLAGTPVRVQGNVVALDGAVVDLSDREAAVLHALAAKVGAVVSKRQLLERVWPGGGSDEHVVEVTVARLRNRLGPAGPGIETVVRRGYRVTTA